jgi:hypothetical protein
MTTQQAEFVARAVAYDWEVSVEHISWWSGDIVTASMRSSFGGATELVGRFDGNGRFAAGDHVTRASMTATETMPMSFESLMRYLIQ